MIQRIPGDTNLTRFALMRGSLRSGWTRIVGAPRNAAIIEAVRDLTSRGVNVEYSNGAIIVKGQGARRGGQFYHVPGDARIAGVWIAAALLCKRDLTLTRVYLTKALESAIMLLRSAGANIDVRTFGHRVSEIVVHPSEMTGFEVTDAIAPSSIPLLALLATSAMGTSSFLCDPAPEGAMHLLAELGIAVERTGETFVVQGPQRLRGAAVRCGGDIDLELAAAVASLVAENDILLDDAQELLLAYPDVLGALHAWNEVRS